MSYNRKMLIGIGLEDTAAWKADGHGFKAVRDKDARWRWISAKPGTLHAFCSGDKVLYIGRTDETLSRHFARLGDPSSGPADKRIFEAIRKLLSAGKDVRILVLAEEPPVSWGPFAVSLSAGIKESLIAAFRPPWNEPEKNDARSKPSLRNRARS